MKKKIEIRLGQLVDQQKKQELKLIENAVFDSEYHSIIRKLSTIRNEKEILKELYINQFADIADFENIEPLNDLLYGKIKGLKKKETESKMRFIMSIEGDKVIMRRKIDGFLNLRTEMIKRFIKDVYGADVNLDSLMINIRTGQYGL